MLLALLPVEVRCYISCLRCLGRNARCNSLHVQALMLTDAQTPFLGAPITSPEQKDLAKTTVDLYLGADSSVSTLR